MAQTLDEILAEAERNAKEKMISGPVSAGAGATVFESGATVYEDGAAVPESGATVYEDGAAVPESGATVYEDGASSPESGATVYEDGASSPESGATVYEDGATVPESGATVFKDGFTVPASGATQPDAPVVCTDSTAIQKGDTILDTYLVESDAIHGGMGSVWKVKHTTLNKQFAVKQPQSRCFETEAQKDAFINECLNWISLGMHPNIISCYAVSNIGDTPAVVSDWMDGGTLADQIEQGTLYAGGEKEAGIRILSMAIQFARGLHYAHHFTSPDGKLMHIIHRDVKPSNLMLSKDGFWKVSDFGIASSSTVISSGIKAETREGHGYTLAYASPEQLEGKPCTESSDVFSWAASVLEAYMGGRAWMASPAIEPGFDGYISRLKVPMPEKVTRLLRLCFAERPLSRPTLDFIIKDLSAVYRELTGEEYPADLKNVPMPAERLNNLAISAFGLGLTQKAESLWLTAQAISYENIECYYNYILSLFASGKIDRKERDMLITRLGEQPPEGDGLPWRLSVYQDFGELKRRGEEIARINKSINAPLQNKSDPGRVAAALDRFYDGCKSPAFYGSEAYENRKNDLFRQTRHTLTGVGRSYMLRFRWKPKDCCLSASANAILVGGANPTILNAIPSAEKPFKTWVTSGGYTYKPLALSDHLQYCATLRSDGCIALFNNLSTDPYIITKRKNWVPSGVSVDDSQEMAVVFCNGCRPYRYNMKKTKDSVIGRFRKYPAQQLVPRLLPSGTKFIFGDGSNTQLRRISSGAVIGQYPGTPLDVSRNERWLAVIAGTGELAVWRIDGESTLVFRDSGHKVKHAAFLNNARQLVWLRTDGSLMLVDLHAPQDVSVLMTGLETGRFYISQEGIRYWDKYGNYCLLKLNYAYDVPEESWDDEVEGFLDCYLAQNPNLAKGEGGLRKSVMLGDLGYFGFGWIKPEAIDLYLKQHR